jgi:hypothetical protein
MVVFTAERWGEIDGLGSPHIDFQDRLERCLRRFCELESHEVESIFPLLNCDPEDPTNPGYHPARSIDAAWATFSEHYILGNGLGGTSGHRIHTISCFLIEGMNLRQGVQH